MYYDNLTEEEYNQQQREYYGIEDEIDIYLEK